MRLPPFQQACRLLTALAVSLLVTACAPAQAQSTSDLLTARVTPRLEQVSRMLNAAIAGDANGLGDAKTEIEELPYPARGDRKTARRLNNTALEKFKHNEMAAALTDFEKAWQADPSDQEITNNYGYVLYRNQRLADAEKLLRYTLALAPARANGWANLAEVFGAQGQSERTASAFVVSHRFSRNPETTRQYIENFSKTSELPGLKDGATLALQKLFPVDSASKAAPQSLATTSKEVKELAADTAARAAATPTTTPVAPAVVPDQTEAIKVPVAVPGRVIQARMTARLPYPEVNALYLSAAKGSVEARTALLRMANDGNARAQFVVGQLYNQGLGVESNMELAVVWFRKSADAGFLLAQFQLAWNQYHGMGTAIDYVAATENYAKAANQGDAWAMTNLAMMLERGQGGAKDHKAALYWYQRAAQQGSVRGLHNVGIYFEWGNGGAPDKKTALAYYRSAAQLGFAQAELKVAQGLEDGWAAPADKTAAVEWYKRAAIQGLEPAKDALKRLGVSDY